MKRSVEDIVASYVEAFNSRDRARWLDLFAPDALHEDPVGRPPRRGMNAIALFWDKAFSRAISITLEPSLIIPASSEAVMVATVHSVQDDRVDEIDAVDVFTFDEQSRIVSLRAFARLRARAIR